MQATYQDSPTMFSTIWNGIERDRMLEGKKIVFSGDPVAC
jgi:hypothetical protein